MGLPCDSPALLPSGTEQLEALPLHGLQGGGSGTGTGAREREQEPQEWEQELGALPRLHSHGAKGRAAPQTPPAAPLAWSSAQP